MKITMRVLEGPEVGREYIFPAEGESGDEATNILVGRDDVECHAHWRLSPADRTVSRAHFILEVRPPNCYVQDNQSKNGLHIQRGNEPERRVSQETLQTGDRLRLGKTVVGFEIYAPVKTEFYTATPQETEVIPEQLPIPAQPTEEQQPLPVSVQPEKAVALQRPPEPPDPEFYCVRCANRLEHSPEEKPLMQSLDFMCASCRKMVEEERRLAEERSRNRYTCSECGRDVTDMARSDGRAGEWKDAAVYLCSTCGDRLRQQKQALGYWIIKRLGAGGAGEVWKVWHPETGRVAALKKMLPIAKAEKRMILRFQREIVIMQNLRHSNIVQLYEAGRDGDSPVFVSEFVPGGDFIQFISDDGKSLLSPEEVVRLIAESLVGLAYFHGKGYVHRDLKPENLLLKPLDGQRIPKVADFGFARSYEKHGGTITRTGEFGGTWMYMPPEQITNFRYVRLQADIYAMGVTTYFLLTGYWPLPEFPTYPQIRSGQVAQLSRTPVQMILHDRRVPLEERRSDLPRSLCRVVNKAIEMKPDDRYQSAEEFRRALLDAL